MPDKFGLQLVELKNQTVKHFTESDWLELATLTGHLDMVQRHGRLLRSLRFGDDDYEGSALTVLRNIVRDDPENLGVIQQYVQQKWPDSGDNISSHDDGGRAIVFVPHVFKAPEDPLDPSLVAVMMPFDSALKGVYDAIKQAAVDAGMRCQRADDLWDDSTIIQDVFSLIFRSYIVVCDFSKRNPNVFYEAGIAHTLGKHVIPIAQTPDDIPFDLRHHRYIQYLNNSEGRQALQEQLLDRMRTLDAKRPSGLSHPW